GYQDFGNNRGQSSWAVSSKPGASPRRVLQQNRPTCPPSSGNASGWHFLCANVALMNFALGQKGRQWRTKRTPQLLRSVSAIRGNASSFTLTPQCLLLTHAGMHALPINLRFVASAGRRQAIPPFGLGRP